MIFFDDEFVKINGIMLDGIFKSLEVSGGALVEEVEVEGKGKKPKQATGYEDCKITIDLTLYDDEKKTKFDKLTDIQNLFRKKGQVKPNVYDIVNEHITNRGIGKVIFKDLSSRETNKKDELQVSLNFLEYEEIKIKASTSKATSKNTGASSKTTSNKNSSNARYNNLTDDYTSYLNNRGNSPKTAKTPAYDVSANIDIYSKVPTMLQQ